MKLESRLATKSRYYQNGNSSSSVTVTQSQDRMTVKFLNYSISYIYLSSISYEHRHCYTLFYIKKIIWIALLSYTHFVLRKTSLCFHSQNKKKVAVSRSFRLLLMYIISISILSAFYIMLLPLQFPLSLSIWQCAMPGPFLIIHTLTARVQLYVSIPFYKILRSACVSVQVS